MVPGRSETIALFSLATEFKKVDLPNYIETFDDQNPLKILYSGAHGESNNLSNVSLPIKKIDFGNR